MPLSEVSGGPLRVMELYSESGGYGRLDKPGADRGSFSNFRVVWSNQLARSEFSQAPDEQGPNFCAKSHAEDMLGLLADPIKLSAITSARPDVLVSEFLYQGYNKVRNGDEEVGSAAVPWFVISGVLTRQMSVGQPVKFLILESEERLLKSPRACRGRNFAIVLASLSELGYAAEWRVVDFANFGYPKKRRRTFLVAYHRSTKLFRRLSLRLGVSPIGWIKTDGILSATLPVSSVRMGDYIKAFNIGRCASDAEYLYATDTRGTTAFFNSGILFEGGVWTSHVEARDLTSFNFSPTWVIPQTGGGKPNFQNPDARRIALLNGNASVVGLMQRLADLMAHAILHDEDERRMAASHELSDARQASLNLQLF